MTAAAVSADELRALTERLDRLEAERDIRDLMVRYAESLDYGDNRAWAACFAPDGLFDVRMRGEAMFAHTGTEALATFASGHTHAPDVYHKHFLSVPRITFDGPDRATAQTYFTMLHERPTGPIVLVIGRYLDELARQQDGWVFTTRVVDMEALPPREG
ncbi:MAG TPA: nuclear transport factor 2 family protein [Jatrophihabitantaceae bacterium]|nr:nuclear transport factor 2 family protein [Jatrophihabitantaceae bacterium]